MKKVKNDLDRAELLWMLEHCTQRIEELEGRGGWQVIPDTMQRYYDERAEMIAGQEGGRG